MELLVQSHPIPIRSGDIIVKIIIDEAILINIIRHFCKILYLISNFKHIV